MNKAIRTLIKEVERLQNKVEAQRINHMHKEMNLLIVHDVPFKKNGVLRSAGKNKKPTNSIYRVITINKKPTLIISTRVICTLNITIAVLPAYSSSKARKRAKKKPNSSPRAPGLIDSYAKSFQ